ncbi:type II CAAX prenyl endopeptidase Rce1 family protein [Halobacterium sp. CBA1126]|uniref:CPBP family glutamic-type intramembrane protease n=1 Tax=Halobacterium TaxID=2239 RepID=UPI0012F7243D|nr:CPBP family glutamic-type intramembrane protease [Halobacterium sp. CBA1126]MUV61041.1 CPBP family intramembrane metalloprotease [Halobacterium sp. CBA1126]
MSLSSRTRRLVRRPNHGVLRAGIRAVVPVLVLLVAFVALSTALGGTRRPYGLAAAQVTQAGLAVAFLAAWARYVDHRELGKYGVRVDADWLLDLAGGALVAGAVVAGSVASGVALGWLDVTAVAHYPDGSFVPAVAAYVVAFAGVAVWEEVAFRALFLTNAAEGFRRWASRRTAVVVAWVVVSVVFGALHLNQAPTPASVLLWVVVGSVPGLAYVLTGQLGFAVGFHFAVDAVVNAGFNLGGAAGVPSFVRLAATGPDAMLGVTGYLTVGWLALSVPLALAWIAARHGLSVDVEIGSR